MNIRYCLVLGFAVTLGGLLAACDDGGDPSALTGLPRQESTFGAGAPAGPGGAPGEAAKVDDSQSATAATNSPAGKQYFLTEVHSSLAQTCGGCHESGPGPAWLWKQDPEKTYAMMFQLGYVSKTGRILQKGIHSGGAASALTAEQSQKINKWIDMELADGGAKAPPNVLEKLGDCLDATKFEAIGLQNLVTTARTPGNNPNNHAEDANQCTGCNQTTCNTCHSSDPGSGFVMAIGNDILPTGYTFAETKKTSPPYLQKYFGVSPTGEPIGSSAIKLKSDATVKDMPYTHPMFVLTPQMETDIADFVADAIDKYKSGACK